MEATVFTLSFISSDFAASSLLHKSAETCHIFKQRIEGNYKYIKR
jgi:hypothetical protein